MIRHKWTNIDDKRIILVVRFTLFLEEEFEVSCPVALIESYCFQSDFYANYDLLPHREVQDVNKIGARIPKCQLDECKRIINSIGSMPFFHYDQLGLDQLLALDNKTITMFVREAVKDIIGPLVKYKGIGLSKATKILHTKYPRIIPMIDSMLKEAYIHIQTKHGGKWTEKDPSNLSQIFVAYYKNLKEPPTKHSLAEVYTQVSQNLPGLTKVRVFDIIWWSYLKAEKLKRKKNNIEWLTIRKWR